MSNRPILQNRIILGIPVALVAGILTKVAVPFPAWLSLGNAEQAKHSNPTRTFEPQMEKVVYRCVCPQKQQIDWQDVFEFVGTELLRLDPQWVVMFVSISLLLLHKAFGALRNIKDTNEVVECHTQTVDIDYEETFHSIPHYEPGQRALLQFQRNKSEPIVFKYSYNEENEIEEEEEEEGEDISEHTVEQIIRRHLRRGGSEPPGTPTHRSVDVTKSNQLSEAEDGTFVFKNESSVSIRTSSASVSPTGTLGDRQDLSMTLGRKPSKSSITLHFQPSPPKPTKLNIGVTQEQVYSQPFTY